MKMDKIITNIIGKKVQIPNKNDWDSDGVPNKKDCQPKNTMRQDAIKDLVTPFFTNYKTKVQGRKII